MSSDTDVYAIKGSLASLSALNDRLVLLQKQRNHLVYALMDIKNCIAGDAETLRKLAALALDQCP